MKRLHFARVLGLLISVAALAFGQYEDPILWFHTDQEIRVANLPPPKAMPKGSSVPATALETVLRDPLVCCGKDSALEDVLLSDRLTLKELGAKVRGWHRLSNGESVFVNATYIAQGAILAESILGPLRQQQALLLEWDSRLYVLYGAAFNEARYSSGRRTYAITRLLLLDPRYNDQRRETAFDRGADDFARVQGILALSVTR